VNTDVRRDERERLKEAALDVLALPVVVLLVAGMADFLAQNPHGATHLLQLMPFVLLIVLAWRFPHATGTVLVMTGSASAIAFLAVIALPPVVAIVTAVVAFMPPIVAGVMLLNGSVR
jgi:hypothetical protein